MEVDGKSSTSSEDPVSPVKLDFDDVELTPVSARKRGYADGGSGDGSEESASKPKRMRENSSDDKEKSICARCSGLEAVSEVR